jgi:hypothetical protein
LCRDVPFFIDLSLSEKALHNLARYDQRLGAREAQVDVE